jgi:hypothetical protein
MTNDDLERFNRPAFSLYDFLNQFMYSFAPETEAMEEDEFDAKRDVLENYLKTAKADDKEGQIKWIMDTFPSAEEDIDEAQEFLNELVKISSQANK